MRLSTLQIINFPMDLAKAHDVKKTCLSTTFWTDVLVWSEPFETVSDASRIISKVLSAKGRLDAIHIYQSLNCKVGVAESQSGSRCWCLHSVCFCVSPSCVHTHRS